MIALVLVLKVTHRARLFLSSHAPLLCSDSTTVAGQAAQSEFGDAAIDTRAASLEQHLLAPVSAPAPAPTLLLYYEADSTSSFSVC
jgi:hypothetical protein